MLLLPWRRVCAIEITHRKGFEDDMEDLLCIFRAIEHPNLQVTLEEPVLVTPGLVAASGPEFGSGP
jgi:hypothetical protein